MAEADEIKREKLREKYAKSYAEIETQIIQLGNTQFKGYVMTMQQLFLCGIIARAYDIIGDLENSNIYANYVTKFYKDIILGDNRIALVAKTIKRQQQELTPKQSADFLSIIFDCLAIRAREPYFELDSYCLALEYNRPPEEKFYEPRRKCFMNLQTVEGEVFSLVQDGQDYIDGKLDFCLTSFIQRAGKSCWGLYVQSLLIQKNLNKTIFGIGHSAGLAEYFYKTIKDILSNPIKYNYFRIFKNQNLFKTNAEKYTLDINEDHPFGNFAFRSIDGDITGSTEASLGLYLDDLVKNQEDILNTETAQKIWTKVNILALGRKKKKVPIYATGTLWGDNCPLTQLIEAILELCELGLMDKSRVRVRILAWHNLQKESQFNYKYNLGFDTNHFLQLEHTLGKTDYPLWSAMYLGNPIPREGRPFNAVEYFNKTDLEERIDSGESYFRFSATDTAIKKKGDHLASGYFYYFENTGDIYLADTVYSNKGSDYTIPKVIEKHLLHNIERSEFEEKETKLDTKITFGFSSEIKKICEKHRLKCLFKTHTGAGLDSKTTRIALVESEIKGIKTTRGFRILFLAPEYRKTHDEYNLAMEHLFNFSYNADKNDDFVDMLSIGMTYCISVKKQKAKCLKLTW